MGLEPTTQSLTEAPREPTVNGDPGASPQVMTGPSEATDTKSRALYEYGAGGGTRTHDLPLTRRLLWPN